MESFTCYAFRRIFIDTLLYIGRHTQASGSNRACPSQNLGATSSRWWWRSEWIMSYLKLEPSWEAGLIVGCFLKDLPAIPNRGELRTKNKRKPKSIQSFVDGYPTCSNEKQPLFQCNQWDTKHATYSTSLSNLHLKKGLTVSCANICSAYKKLPKS